MRKASIRKCVAAFIYLVQIRLLLVAAAYLALMLGFVVYALIGRALKVWLSSRALGPVRREHA